MLHDQLAYAAIDAGAVTSLQWLAAAGFTYTSVRYTKRASSCGQYGALQYLIVVAGCPWPSVSVRRQAVISATGDVLEWLKQADAESWSLAELTKLMYTAGLHDNLSAAKWLRAQGAEWPWTFVIVHGAEPKQRSPFGLHTMHWALASGCPWGRWGSSSCMTLCSQASVLSSQAAQNAITWAHAAGCPCNSELHHFAARLQHGKRAIRDVNMPKRRRWHASLFKLCYTRGAAVCHAIIVILVAVAVCAFIILAAVAVCASTISYWQQNQMLQQQEQQQQQLVQQQQQQWQAQGRRAVTWDEKHELYEPVHRELLEWELRSARRLWPDDVRMQARLINEYLQRSIAEYQLPSSHPFLEQCLAVPSAVAATVTTAAVRHDVERVQQEQSEQQQQQFAKAIMAYLLGWKFSTAQLPPQKQCIAAAKQYWPVTYAEWHEYMARTQLEVQMLSARVWWPSDVELQTVLIRQYLRDSVYTQYLPIRSSSDPLCVAIP
jgi:hypothetical protein